MVDDTWLGLELFTTGMRIEMFERVSICHGVRMEGFYSVICTLKLDIGCEMLCRLTGVGSLWCPVNDGLQI
jgi:hypothetical protein